MITAIELENFKCVGPRTRIDLAPLTLLFGANNAGKSTILQSLLYALELLDRDQPDVDRTELGGAHIDLGGFARLVHRHDLTRTISIRIEIDRIGALNCFERELKTFPFPNFEDELTAAWIELRVRQLDTHEGLQPFLTDLLVGTPGIETPIIHLSMTDEPADLNLRRVALDLAHPIFAADEEGRKSLLAATPASASAPSNTLRFALFAGQRTGVLPSLEDPPLTGGPTRATRDLTNNYDPNEWAAWLLEMAVYGTCRQLARSLREAIYVGPLRAVPPRSFLSERSARLTRWADGLAAWDALLADRSQLLEQTNLWLARLGTGCKLRIQQLIDTEASAEALSVPNGEATVRRLLIDLGRGTTVFPCEVGVGISQIVPIVVAALEGTRRRLALMEQPELHVHPALQVGLGDLFITATRGRQLLIETHSEHLLLRLLRRIRETTARELPPDAPEFTPERLSVLYVEADDDGMRVRKLRVDPTGEFLDRWPKGFFEERADEVF